MVAAAKIRTLALITIAHHPNVVPGTRAASDSTRALVKTSRAADARSWNVTRVWACLAWPGCTETATKSSPINAPVALAVAKKLVVLLRDHRVDVKARGAQRHGLV